METGHHLKMFSPAAFGAVSGFLNQSATTALVAKIGTYDQAGEVIFGL
jgi:hypothetical protein